MYLRAVGTHYTKVVSLLVGQGRQLTHNLPFFLIEVSRRQERFLVHGYILRLRKHVFY